MFRLVILTGLAAVLLGHASETTRNAVFGFAGAVARDAVTFCDRHGAVCHDGAQIWDGLKEKALVGGREALRALPQYLDRQPQPNAPAGAHEPRSSLRGEDAVPSWRGGRNDG